MASIHYTQPEVCENVMTLFKTIKEKLIVSIAVSYLRVIPRYLPIRMTGGGNSLYGRGGED